MIKDISSSRTYIQMFIIFLIVHSRIRYTFQIDIWFTGRCDTSVIRFRQIDQGSDVDGMQQTPSKLHSFIHVTYHLCSACYRIDYAFTCPSDAGLHLYSKCRSWMNTETTNMNPKCRITYLTWKEKGISYWLEELLLLKSSQACIVKCLDNVCMAMYGNRNGNHKKSPNLYPKPVVCKAHKYLIHSLPCVTSVTLACVPKVPCKSSLWHCHCRISILLTNNDTLPWPGLIARTGSFLIGRLARAPFPIPVDLPGRLDSSVRSS